MRGWMVGLAVSLAWVAGCSHVKKPVPISGVVRTASGKPVTGVRLILVPADGSPLGSLGFPLDGEGRFEGAALPGTYTFYLTTVAVERDDDDGRPVNSTEAKKLKASAQQLRMIPAPYRKAEGAGPDRKVEVAAGATLTLIVSP